ncbi:MAG: penicillin acylase family protein [Chryseolinea sp.]
MRVIKFLISLSVTLLLIFVLDRRWDIGGAPIPPVARFLDPLGGFWRNIEPTDMKAPEPMPIQGVTDDITIILDSLAIPHIFAANDLDLYFAQGYVTARHRLWQMEFLTHAAAGRVSEIAGVGKDNAILDYDRGQRRLGMVYAAKRGLDALVTNQETMIMLEKYTEGVNAYINTLSYKNLPFEYKLLNYSPEKWTTMKCLLLLKSMAQSLTMREKDMEMTNTLKLFGPEMVSLLFPDKEGVPDPIIDNPGGWKFNRTISDSIPLALPDELIKLQKLPGPNPANGSNNWVVSGAKTSTGAPILSGDPHLDLSMPSLWYAIQLHAPGINAIGTSLPGLPGVIIGCTDSIAWSETNAQRDMVDWYKIKFEDGTRNKYWLDSQWVESKKVVEKFVPRGSDIFYDTIVYTEWGPIPYDASFHSKDNRTNYAFKWMGHEPTEDVIAIYKLNRANNYKQFTEAISHAGCPGQNFAFASMSGDIAMHVQGKFPLRRQLEGKFVLDGSRKSSGWLRTIPTQENIFRLNPARGFESSANQYPADETYPFYITAGSFEAYRNRRINNELRKMQNIKVSDMMKLQTDNYNLKAAEILPLMIEQLKGSNLNDKQKDAVKLISSWDYIDDPGSDGATYFEVWFRKVIALTWDEMQSDEVLLQRPTDFTTIKFIRENPSFIFFDIKSTPEVETAGDIIRKAFLLSVDDIDQWKKAHHESKVPWGDYKNSFINHLLRISALGQQIPGGGSAETINALTKSHGPSWRMIASLEKTGIKMWAVYPGGQSGNPGSRYYNNMTDHWLHGKYYELKSYATADEAQRESLYKLEIEKPRH